MKAVLLLISLIVGLLVLALGFDSIRTVEEGHRGIQLRFGEMVLGDESLPAGIHFIRPITDEVIPINTEVRIHKFDDRLIKWQVTHPARYYRGTSNDEHRMNGNIERRVNNLPAGRDVAELNRILQPHFGVVIVSAEWVEGSSMRKSN